MAFEGFANDACRSKTDCHPDLLKHRMSSTERKVTSTDSRTDAKRQGDGLPGVNFENSYLQTSGSEYEDFADSKRASSPHDHPSESHGRGAIVGYNPANFLNQLDPKYTCGVCLRGLRNAVQTDCGHRFCEFCIQQLRKPTVTSVAQCPIDRQPLIQVFPDIFCRREIMSLRVRCCNYTKGCCWTGELVDFHEHLKVCGWEMIQCPNVGCQQRIQRQHLNEHLQEKCSCRMVTCEHCKDLIPYSNLKIHVRDVCSNTPKMCPYNCGDVVPRTQLSRHLTECSQATSTCSFHELGFTFSGTLCQMKPHEGDLAAAAHHILACKVVSDKTNGMASVKAENDKTDEVMATLSSKVEQLESKLSQQMNSLEHHFQQLESSVLGSANSSRPGEALQTHVLSLERVSATNEMNLNAAQCQLTELHTKVQKLSREASNGLALAGDHDLRLIGLETAAYDGVLIWKINFEKAMADAKSGTKMSIYSPPFYSSRYGYKMCARLYPLGDGIGRSSHISFFFVVMNGENDAILHWPFQQRVTLTLIDQSPARRDVSETFLPDVRSSSFQRPTSGMNVASGCPRFVSHNLLQSRWNTYIEDGVMFLKVSVDRTGLDQP